MTADALRDRIAQAIESVTHDPGGRPCELCMETADTVMAVLAEVLLLHARLHPPPTRGPEEAHTEGFPCPSCGHRLSAYDWCPACLAHQPPPSTEEAHDGR